MQYADDTPIVLRGDLQEVQDLKNILNSFANATGLQISFHKSTAVPINMPDDLIQHCTSVLGCRSLPSKLLGPASFFFQAAGLSV